MNRALPVALGLILIGILAVEGKLSGLWKAITTTAEQPMQSVGNATVDTSRLSSSTNASTGTTNVAVPVPLSTLQNGITSGGMSVNAMLAQRRFAVDNGTDPVLNQYFYNHAATNDPVLNANWSSFINCYLQGGDTKQCADRWLPKG